jgi:hypothetical protein
VSIQNASPCLTQKPIQGLGADSEEKRAPVGDINTALVDRLKALYPNRPIREADIGRPLPRHLQRTSAPGVLEGEPSRSCLIS